MDKPQNKYIAVSYKLYAIADGEATLVEQTTDERPFQFISGFGISHEEFEAAVINMPAGEEFDFTLPKDKSFGDYDPRRVVELDRSHFCINGHFDHDNIYVGALVPLQNEDGNRFIGKVTLITDEAVTMDLNHPLAGKDLNFKGRIIESRPATNEEIEAMINRLSDDGCGCGCDDCEGHHHHDEGSCGCGHDHDHHHGGGCGCGHCH